RRMEATSGSGGEAVDVFSPAEFVCNLTLYVPGTGHIVQVEGTCPGYIASHPRGDGGFGYDPLFYLPEFGRTMAELSMEEKNRISHRAKAMGMLLEAME
ncbi:non-canonical purine NTP pyrophosphatase, partial [Gorillibacterium massiliense]|uniref:non-canonical purine NTP pyrophosphatase n=1 Tax=Gorillibacterium massiliense TaxID=1280390 RepID=UPI000593676C